MCILKKLVKKTQDKDKQAKTSLMDRDFSGAQFYLHCQKSAKNENLRPIEGQMETLFFVYYFAYLGPAVVLFYLFPLKTFAMRLF